MVSVGSYLVALLFLLFCIGAFGAGIKRRGERRPYAAMWLASFALLVALNA